MSAATLRSGRVVPALAMIIGLASSAGAQVADSEAGPAQRRAALEIVGAALPACLIQPGVTAQGSNASFRADPASGGLVQINQLADAATAQPNAMAIRIALPLICNTAHSIVLHSRNGGMLRAGGTRTPGTAFTEFLPYRVRGDWAGQDGSGRSDDAQAVQFNVPNAGQGLLLVDIAIDKGGLPLVAGSYEDTLQIDIAVSS